MQSRPVAGRGAYVAFTDEIHRAVREETEQTRKEMWQQPVSTAGRCFCSSFTPVLFDAWVICWLLALVTAKSSCMGPKMF